MTLGSCQAIIEEIALQNNSVDTVLITYTLCSIKNAEKALREIKRVLKQDGQLLFCEHGIAPDVNVQTWQHRLNPFWKHIAGGM